MNNYVLSRDHFTFLIVSESEESVCIRVEDSTDTVLEDTTLGIAEMAVQGEEEDIESHSDGGSLMTTGMLYMRQSK